MDDELANSLRENTVLFENLIIQHHIIVIAATSGCGKTTIMHWVCRQISESIKVTYVTADEAADNSRSYYEYAKGHYLYTDLNARAISPSEYFNSLLREQDLSNRLYVFDTLKKFTNVMHKDVIKQFMIDLRTLTNKGATIVLLAHTNKETSAKKEPIFEGVGDIKSDVDELFYLKSSSKDLPRLVTCTPEKARGAIKSTDFHINENREITHSQHIDNHQMLANQRDLEIDDAISHVLSGGIKNQSEVVECLQVQDFRRDHIRARLKAGTGLKWTKSRGPRNASLYDLMRDLDEEHDSLCSFNSFSDSNPTRRPDLKNLFGK